MTYTIKRPWARQPQTARAYPNPLWRDRGLSFLWSGGSLMEGVAGEVPTMSSVASISPSSNNAKALVLPNSGEYVNNGLTFTKFPGTSAGPQSVLCVLKQSGIVGNANANILSGSFRGYGVDGSRKPFLYASSTFTCTESIPLDTWCVVVFVLDPGNDIKFYINGDLKTTLSTVGVYEYTIAGAYVGGHPGWGSLVGSIALVGYSKALWSNAEVRSLSANPWQLFKPRQIVLPSNGTAASTVLYWVVYAATGSTPTGAQIVAGKDATGSNALSQGSEPYVSGIVDEQTIISTLQSGQEYKVAWVAYDGAQYSNVSESNTITTTSSTVVLNINSTLTNHYADQPNLLYNQILTGRGITLSPYTNYPDILRDVSLDPGDITISMSITSPNISLASGVPVLSNPQLVEIAANTARPRVTVTWS
jgi:hypothetical protein